MTVYWILLLFWDDGKLEFDCSRYSEQKKESTSNLKKNPTQISGEEKGASCVVQSNSNLPSSQNSGKIQYTVIFAADGFVIK